MSFVIGALAGLLVWSLVGIAAGLQMRDPEVTLVSTGIASATVTVLVWLIV